MPTNDADADAAPPPSPSPSPSPSPFTSSTRTFQRVPSATSLLPPTSERGLTADDLIAHQHLLETQAREAIPFSYTRASCTHARGYIRQPLWACTDCGGGAVCAGCSIGCHAEHQLIELFAKRGFRCDCGCPSLQRRLRQGQGRTATDAHTPPPLQPCNLRPPPLDFATQNDDNVYTKNFDGHFCYCPKGYHYDPMEEEETMFQCLVCEEWLHETCTSLRTQTATTTTTTTDGDGAHKGDLHHDNSAAHDDAEEDISPPPPPPPPLISHDCFDNVICDACIRRHPVLHAYVGVSSWGACLQLPPAAGDDDDDDDVVVQAGDVDQVVCVPDATTRRFLVLGLPVNADVGASDGVSSGAGAGATTSTSRALKRDLSPIVEGEGEGGEDGGEGRQDAKGRGHDAAKRLKVEHDGHGSDGSDGSVTGKRDGAADEKKKQDQDVSARSTDCRRPSVHPLVQKLLQRGGGGGDDDEEARAGPANPNDPEGKQRPSYRLDVFLDDGEGDAANGDSSASSGFRAQFCRCRDCLAALDDAGLTFLLAEEETYSPPASEVGEAGAGERRASHSHSHSPPDSDAGSHSSSQHSHSSTYDLGLSALHRLPRAQTLEALQGYGRLRNALFEHLRPFAESGRTVDEESIRRFFEEQRRRDAEGGR